MMGPEETLQEEIFRGTNGKGNRDVSPILVAEAIKAIVEEAQEEPAEEANDE